MPPWDSSCQNESMNRVEKLEGDVRELSSEELASFRAWFAEYDWKSWDQQLVEDVEHGRLDALAEESLNDHEADLTKPL
jgi:hypothetical protein